MKWLRLIVFGAFLAVLGGFTLKGIAWAVTGSWDVGRELFLLVFASYFFGALVGTAWAYVVCTTPDQPEKVKA